MQARNFNKPWIKTVATYTFTSIWLTWMLVLATNRLIKAFPPPEAELNGDAANVYLPAARAILEGPWDFFTTSTSSLFVVPLANIWPAIWGADPARIQLANSVLFLLCVVFVWRLTYRLGGWLAGMAATALFATNQYLINLMPQVLTEPLYMFGFLLFIMSAAEYMLATKQARGWLALATLGLTITLMSRPVLQIFTIFGLTIVTIMVFWLHVKKRSLPSGWNRLLHPATMVALSVSLALPAATIVKNGICFQYWGMGTGAGSGLQYGLSPFNMGMEPIFGGYPYDAGHVPFVADASTQGIPLDPRSDSIMTRTAVSLVKNTTFADNATFFAFKLKAWMLGSQPELITAPAMKPARVFQWLAIGFALLLVAIAGVARDPERHRIDWRLKRDLLPNSDGKGAIRLGMYFFMLLLTLGMAAQFIPILYNTRYNLGFFDPLLIPLCAISLSMLLRLPAKETTTVTQTAPASSRRKLLGWAAWITPRIFAIVLLWYVPALVTQHATRHKAWPMDPLRPGPTELALASTHIGVPSALNADSIGINRWKTTKYPAQLIVPVDLEHPELPLDFLSGFWRYKLSVLPPHYDRNCRDVWLQLSKPSPELFAWYAPEPTIQVALDGKVALYAGRANGQLRPSASGDMTLTFNCPPGTIIEWGGAQILKSSMAESARDLIKYGTPVNPYRADDIR